MRNPCIVFAVTASALASVGWAETIDFTSPLAFTGGTEYVESADSAWASNRADPLVLSVSGTGNSITRTHNSPDNQPWRKVVMTGDGYLTFKGSYRWTFAYDNGTDLRGFSGTAHFEIADSIEWYGVADEGARSMKSMALVFEPLSASNNRNVFFSSVYDNGFKREIGDLSTSGAYGKHLNLCSKTGLCDFYVGHLNKSSTFAGNFVHNSDYGIVKVGTGTWTLTGSVDAHRPFVVQEGTVLFNGNSVSSALEVRAGAKLGGSGTLTGAVSGEAGALIVPHETEALTVTAAANLTGFGVATDGLDPAKTYLVAKSTSSCPKLTAAQAQSGWVIVTEDGNVVLKNSSTVINENTQLTEGTDWSASYVSIAAGVTIDLNGQTLKLANFSLAEGAAFVNTSDTQARLVFGCNGGDKTAALGLNLPSGILPVFTGAPFDIPSSYVPAGGIGFKDLTGAQLIPLDTCANGLAFLGNAMLKEPRATWNSGDGGSFTVRVEGEGNSFAFDNGNGGTVMGVFKTTPFEGDGTLTIGGVSGTGYWLTSKNTTVKDFTGKLVLKTCNDTWPRGVALQFEDDNNEQKGTMRQATIALANDEDRPAYYSLRSDNYGTPPTFDVAALVTEGAHADKIELFAHFNANIAGTLRVGRNGDGAGVFAGSVLNTEHAINLEKYGEGVWSLTGVLSAGGYLKACAGTLSLDGATVGTVTEIQVKNGGTLAGTSTIPAEVPLTFDSGAVLSGALTLKTAPTVAQGAKIVPSFAGSVPLKLTFDYADPSLAAFTLDSDYTPVVPVGTQFVIAEGPVGSTIVAPQHGASAVELGWTVEAVGNQVIVTTTKLAPLIVDGTLVMAEDYDYSAASATFDDGAVVDLNGHMLKLSAVTTGGNVTFCNSSATAAFLEVGYDDQDKLWLFNATIQVGVIPVFTGAAIDIPNTFVPPSGIGFRDTTGERAQDLYIQSCANGLLFLGDANVREPAGKQNWNSEPTFTVTVVGTNNVFTADGGRYSSTVGEFARTPFVGDGELIVKSVDSSRFKMFALDRTGGAAFTGRIVLMAGANFGGFSRLVAGPHAENTEICLGNDLEAASLKNTFALYKESSEGKRDFRYGLVTTAGSHPELVTLTAHLPPNQGGTYDVTTSRLNVGAGDASGVFAGRITRAKDETDYPFCIEKTGTGTWTLMQSVANGGAFTVSGGTVVFASGLADVSKLTVKDGASACLAGTLYGNAAETDVFDFQAGATLVLEPGRRAVVNGAVDLTGVKLNVPGTEEQGKHGCELLRATAITGFDPALATTTLCTNPKKYRFDVVDNSDGTQSLRYVTNIGFVVILR